MNKNEVIISGVNLVLTDLIKAAVHKKMDKLMLHEHAILSAKIDLKYDPHASTHHNEFIAQGHLHLKGHNLMVTEHADDLYVAIGAMVEKLDRQLRKRANRAEHKRNHPHAIELKNTLPKISS